MLFFLSACDSSEVVPVPDDYIPNSGQIVFVRQCSSCHHFAPSADVIGKRTGPNLFLVYGSPIASSDPAYPYSRSLRNASLIWDNETLNRFLENPHKTLPGTAMSYPGLHSPDDRQAVIAYLQARNLP